MLPQPWAAARVQRVYAYQSDTLDYHLRRRRDELGQLLQQPPSLNISASGGGNGMMVNATAAWHDVFARLSAQGIHAGPLGIELARGAHFPPRDGPTLAALHAALQLLVAAPPSP